MVLCGEYNLWDDVNFWLDFVVVAGVNAGELGDVVEAVEALGDVLGVEGVGVDDGFVET